MSNAEPQNDSRQALQKIVARSWSEPAFKARFAADPRSVLVEHGLSVPEGLEIKVVENSDQVVHLTLPARPSGDLSDDQLNEIAGGIVGGFGGSLDEVRLWSHARTPAQVRG